MILRIYRMRDSLLRFGTRVSWKMALDLECPEKAARCRAEVIELLPHPHRLPHGPARPTRR